MESILILTIYKLDKKMSVYSRLKYLQYHRTVQVSRN